MRLQRSPACLRPLLASLLAFATSCAPAGELDGFDVAAGPTADGGAPTADAGVTDAGATDSGSADAGATDSGGADAGTSDAAATDSGSADAGAFDAAATDSGSADVGTSDAGATDSGSADAGAADAGESDGGVTKWPTTPPAQICGNTALLNGPSSAPAGAITVPAGNNSSVDFSQTGKTYWFAPGVHTLGTGEYDQIIPGDNSTFLGAPGAIIDGQGLNNYAFTQQATNVTIKYLTIRNFNAPMNEGVVNHDSGDGWRVEYTTIVNNKGAAMMLGSNNTVRYSCLKDNGQYGFNAYKCASGDYSNYPSSCANLGAGTGTKIVNLLLEYNEIAHNNTDDWETQQPGCGCTGGGKFWDVEGAVVRNNWVHHNLSVGLWADTNNRNFLFQGNLIEDNTAQGIWYEISYNARIQYNTLRRNLLGHDRDSGSFPDGALYLSEAGGDPIAGGSYTTLEVVDNYFEDNWNGVTLWENADRYCASPANTSSDYCTLAFAAGYDMTSCSQTNISGHLDACRWKTQNVLVARNVFKIDKAAIGCTNTSCGRNAMFSNYGTYPDWSPYKATTVQQAITFEQNNVFRDNTYIGDWRFVPYDMSRTLTFTQWRASPYLQDQGSIKQ